MTIAIRSKRLVVIAAHLANERSLDHRISVLLGGSPRIDALEIPLIAPVDLLQNVCCSFGQSPSACCDGAIRCIDMWQEFPDDAGFQGCALEDATTSKTITQVSVRVVGFVAWRPLAHTGVHRTYSSREGNYRNRERYS